jgi:hypothetical protein
MKLEIDEPERIYLLALIRADRASTGTVWDNLVVKLAMASEGPKKAYRTSAKVNGVLVIDGPSPKYQVAVRSQDGLEYIGEFDSLERAKEEWASGTRFYSGARSSDEILDLDPAAKLPSPITASDAKIYYFDGDITQIKKPLIH